MGVDPHRHVEVLADELGHERDPRRAADQQRRVDGAGVELAPLHRALDELDRLQDARADHRLELGAG